VFAITLGLKISGANTLLDRLSPTLRHALYMAVPDQEQLEGIEPSTPLLRSKLIEEVKIALNALEGWTLAVDHGIDESEPVKMGGCKVDKFKVLPHEGGSIDLMFRVGSNDIDATEAGLLCSHLSQEISFTLTAPIKPAEPIDGTQEAFEKDHPDAGELFAAGADVDADTGDGDTGTNVTLSPEAAWPFPKPGDHGEATPQSVTIEQSQPGTRTARGREKTKAALAAGTPT
jgi:hypothetical protein